MLQYHDGALGGHLSARKTFSRLKRKYFWINMKKDVKNWCDTCEICRTRRNTGGKIKVPLKPINVIAKPM